MKSSFYSVRPVGNNIPFGTIARAFKRIDNHLGTEPPEVLREVLGSGYFLYLSSGSTALWVILKALLEFAPKKREVIIPAYTCPAVAAGVLRAGLRPVLADVNLEDFGFSINDLQKKMGRETLAVVVVHLFGHPANFDEVYECCKRHDIFVVEDAAQAFGNGVIGSPDKKLGLLGDAGFFSFGRGKPISVLHGGVLATKSQEIYRSSMNIRANLNSASTLQNLEYLIMLSFYWVFSKAWMYWVAEKIPFLHLGETIFKPGFVMSKGIRFSLSIISELVGFMEEEKRIREDNSRWYSDNLEDIGWIQSLAHPAYPYLRYPLLIRGNAERDWILKKLRDHRTGSALFYPSPLNELAGLKDILKDASSYPNAQRLSETLITLPVHTGVTARDRLKIKSIINEVVN